MWVQVDADAHRELGERFGVRGFPTIKFFGRGQSTASPEEYVASFWILPAPLALYVLLAGRQSICLLLNVVLLRP